MKLRNLIILFCCSLLAGCIENPAIENANSEFENAALLLREVEERGDYLNSPYFPSIKNASEVYSEMSNYIILDVRNEDHFQEGHIQGALNQSKDGLFNYVTNTNEVDKQFLIVSSTGQASAYYTSLFRLYGLQNVYSLNFGMAGWNTDFSYLIENKLNNTDQAPNFHNVDNPKPPFSHLPQVSKPADVSIEVFFKDKITSLFAEGFEEDISVGNSTVNAMDYHYFEDFISDNVRNENMIICSGNANLYFLGQLGMLANPGHPKGAILYKIFYPVSELSSTKYLQTLFPDKPIGLYSYSGQLSAMGTAFLRLLNYNARSVLFGAHAMFYNRLISSEALQPFAYQRSLVKDLPYVK